MSLRRVWRIVRHPKLAKSERIEAATRKEAVFNNAKTLKNYHAKKISELVEIWKNNSGRPKTQSQRSFLVNAENAWIQQRKVIIRAMNYYERTGIKMPGSLASQLARVDRVLGEINSLK